MEPIRRVPCRTRTRRLQPVLALGLAATLLAGCGSDQDGANGAEPEGVTSYEVVAGIHVTTPVDYPQTPPVGGEHNPVWLNCGTYDAPVPSENAVHSMEHGAVWVTYTPDLSDADVETLREQMPATYAILSPMADLPAPVVATAWGKQLVLDGADDPRLAQFITAFAQSPQAPEAGASCTGGSDGTLPLDVAELME